MAGVPVHCRAILNKQVHISHGNKDLYLASGHCRGHRELVQVPGVVVVKGSPEEIFQVTNRFKVPRCRHLDLAKFGDCFCGKVREQSRSSIALRAMLCKIDRCCLSEEFMG